MYWWGCCGTALLGFLCPVLFVISAFCCIHWLRYCVIANSKMKHVDRIAMKLVNDENKDF